MSILSPLRLHLDGNALVANWLTLDQLSGEATCGAAVKANGYGLDVCEVVPRLAEAGCQDFFVATWAEATEIVEVTQDLALGVFHGVREEDMVAALASPARPCLNSAEQVRRWRNAGGSTCDVMVDTGINRLGLSVEEATSGLLDDLDIDILMSHLACADEVEHPLNRIQRDALEGLRGRTAAKRLSLSNSAGIALGADFGFDLTRPGLSLYGGVQVEALAPHIQQVVTPEAQILQRRRIEVGDSVGYNATFTASEPMELAILNLGYADGYLRGFSGTGSARTGDVECPLIGRVSMDLIAVDVGQAPELDEGDWLAIDYHLPTASAQSGLSQYELLTVLGDRYQRDWI